MPELSRFYGIVIRMYFDDHLPPHFHVLYEEHEALIGVETLALIEGRLPPRAAGLVTEWATLHHEELRQAWRRAKNLEPPGKIEPLA
ncbi:MAG: DUF4160 domain-containing protein [Chloroflexi bacterium]|nr:DUF4160 domain-containing protein [Chloroflexota bacterium]